MRISDWSSDVCSSDLSLDHPEIAICKRPNAVLLPNILLGLCQSGQCPHREASASCCRPHREPQISPVNCPGQNYADTLGGTAQIQRSEEHTSELQSLMRISYAVFCLKKKTNTHSIKLQYTKSNTKYIIHKT